MSRHDDDVSLRQMLDHARESVGLTAHRSRADIEGDRVLYLAILQLLQIIGEAASRVSPDRRASHPEVPWAAIIGLRNRLIHGYDRVDIEILWNVVHDDLPGLIEALSQIVGTGSD